jgi:hypothetical protein
METETYYQTFTDLQIVYPVLPGFWIWNLLKAHENHFPVRRPPFFFFFCKCKWTLKTHNYATTITVIRPCAQGPILKYTLVTGDAWGAPRGPTLLCTAHSILHLHLDGQDIVVSSNTHCCVLQSNWWQGPSWNRTVDGRLSRGQAGYRPLGASCCSRSHPTPPLRQQ